MTDIYLVDDHALMRDGLRAVLHSGGHRVVGETDDPTRALADLQRLQPQILLLDLNLGQRSGLELLEQIQRRALAVRTIVLTMVAEPGPLTRALQLGASGYVLKGSPAAELLAAVRAVAEHRRYLSPEAAALLAEGVAAPRSTSALEQLSARERQVVAMVVRGRSSAEIGELLHLSPKTVDTYRSRLMAKLGVADVPALVRLAVREGLISADER